MLISRYINSELSICIERKETRYHLWIFLYHHACALKHNIAFIWHSIHVELFHTSVQCFEYASKLCFVYICMHLSVDWNVCTKSLSKLHSVIFQGIYHMTGHFQTMLTTALSLGRTAILKDYRNIFETLENHFVIAYKFQ